MRSDEAKLAARREELLRRSAELRSRIIADASAISVQLRVVDKATAFLRSGGGRALVWGGILLMLFTGPGRVLKVASRTAVLWSLVRRWLPRALALKRGPHRA
jgi:hypothetical protein